MKYLVLLFVINYSLFSSEYYTYDLNSNLVDSYKLSDNLFLIEGDMKSCLLYNSITKEYKELYTNHLSKITSVELHNDILYIGSSQDLTVLNINNNSLIKDIELSSPVSEIFEQNNHLFISRKNGVIDELSINYTEQAIEYKKVDSISNIISKVKLDDKLYLLSSNNSLYEFDGKLKYVKTIENEANPLRIVSMNNNLFFIYKYQFEIYSETFEFVERNFLNTQNYAIVEDGYFTSSLSGNTITLKKYDFEKNLLETNNNEIDIYLRINNINSMFSTKDNVIIIGDKKLIVEFDKPDLVFQNRSAIHLTNRLELGNISFANKRIGAYGTNESFLFITENGGATWKSIDKTEDMVKINYEFNYVKYFDSTSFIAFSNPYNGTFLSNNNGKTYRTISTPSNGSAYTIPFINKYEDYTIFTNSYTGIPVGHGLYIANYNEEYESLKDTFLVGFYILDAAMINEVMNILVYERINGFTFKYSIIRTDAEMSFINHDTKFYDHEQVYAIEAIGNSNYILVRGNDEPNKQYLLKADKMMTKLDTLKVLDNKYYYETYTNNNKLYIKDSLQRIYYFDEQSDELEQLIALNDTVKFKMNVQIFDDAIYSSYKGAFLKSVRIGELSEITGVSIEGIPSFYIHKSYPNPANNKFKVKIDYDLSLSLNEIIVKFYDITGAEISKNIDFKINNYNTFSLEVESDISNLNNGVYFMQLKFGNKTETVPFVKE